MQPYGPNAAQRDADMLAAPKQAHVEQGKIRSFIVKP